MDKEISKLRGEIDKIDGEILSLIHQRVQLARKVGKRKGEMNKKNPVYLSTERQMEILRHVKKRSREMKELSDEALTSIFTEIISLCLNAEATTRVIYLGPPGTYTQQAAMNFFGQSSEFHPVHSIPEVFREVEAKNALYGVVPIENSSEGMVSNTMDVFLNSPLYIVGEIKMPVHPLPPCPSMGRKFARYIHCLLSSTIHRTMQTLVE